jgi:hypothetical protein
LKVESPAAFVAGLYAFKTLQTLSAISGAAANPKAEMKRRGAHFNCRNQISYQKMDAVSLM